jgi:hypothetical protein
MRRIRVRLVGAAAAFVAGGLALSLAHASPTFDLGGEWTLSGEDSGGRYSGSATLEEDGEQVKAHLSFHHESSDSLEHASFTGTLARGRLTGRRSLPVGMAGAIEGASDSGTAETYRLSSDGRKLEGTFGEFHETLARAVAIDRGPYLQATTTQSVTIVWRTSSATDSIVTYRSGSQAPLTAGESSAHETTHAVTITGLTTAAHYSYRIVADGVAAGDWTAFATAPGPDASFTALAFGDSGSGDAPQRRMASRLSAQACDLIVHLGDVIYPAGEAALYDPNFFVPYHEMLKTHPIFPCLGNHDLLSQGGRPFFDAFYMNANNSSHDKRYYSFEWGNTKFISIETTSLFQTAGPHQEWLANELASSTRRWKVVFMHVGLYSPGEHGDSPHLQHMLQEKFEDARVDLVLQGHDHLYARTNPIKEHVTDASWPGITYVVTGGGGANLYPVHEHPHMAKTDRSHHCVLLTFGESIHGTAIRDDGSTADDFEIAHQP